jgi:hypothetical protein
MFLSSILPESMDMIVNGSCRNMYVSYFITFHTTKWHICSLVCKKKDYERWKSSFIRTDVDEDWDVPDRSMWCDCKIERLSRKKKVLKAMDKIVGRKKN